MPLSDSVQTILDETRQVYLNDISGATYTNDILLPFLKVVYDQYQTKLQVNSVQFSNKAADITVRIGETFLRLPIDFMYPVMLKERPLGSFDPSAWIDMEQVPWNRSIQRSNELRIWVYHNGEVVFNGALTDRQVRLFYQKSFPELVDGKSLVESHCKSHLASKTAAMVHMLINQNTTLAEVSNDIASEQMNEILKIAVKRVQSLTTRRRPYRPFWR